VSDCAVAVAHSPAMGKKGALNSWRTDDGEYSRKYVKRCDKNRYRNESIKHRHNINHHNYGDNHLNKDATDGPEDGNTADNETTYNVPSDRRSALKLERKSQRQRKFAFEKFYCEDDTLVDAITRQLPVSLSIEVEAPSNI